MQGYRAPHQYSTLTEQHPGMVVKPRYSDSTPVQAQSMLSYLSAGPNSGHANSTDGDLSSTQVTVQQNQMQPTFHSGQLLTGM